MASGKTLKLRQIKVMKRYAVKDGDRRVLADGSIYVVNYTTRTTSHGIVRIPRGWRRIR